MEINKKNKIKYKTLHRNITELVSAEFAEIKISLTTAWVSFETWEVIFLPNAVNSVKIADVIQWDIWDHCAHMSPC